MMNKLFLRQILVFVIGCAILSIGIACANLAKLGIGVYDAFVLNLATATSLTYGNVSVLLGAILVLVQLIIRKEFDMEYIIQMVILVVFSAILDLLMYTLI